MAVGPTQRPAVLPFFPCDHDQDFGLPLAQKYVTSLAAYLAGKNADTFKDDLAIALFCVRVQSGRSLNAIADPAERSVTLYTPLLLSATTDAQVAAALSHELAHITMRHGWGGSMSQVDGVALTERQADLKAAMREMAALQKEIANKTPTLLATAEARWTKALKAQAKKMEELVQVMTDAASAAQSVPTRDDAREQGAAPDGARPRDLPAWPEIPLTAEVANDRESYVTARRVLTEVIAAEHSPEENAKFAAEERVLNDQLAKSDLLKSRIIALKEQIAAIEGAGLSREDLANGREREADEVGQIFYLRAGFKSYLFDWLFADMTDKASVAAQLSGDRRKVVQDIDQALAACVAARAAAGKDIERGYASHPAPCWRLYNSRIRRPVGEMRDFAALEQAATEENVVASPSLSEVKAEIISERSGSGQKPPGPSF